jgi:hypothetical protein
MLRPCTTGPDWMPPLIVFPAQAGSPRVITHPGPARAGRAPLAGCRRLSDAEWARNMVTAAADQAPDEAGFFTQLREAGVLLRLRFSEINPGQVTGYSVTLPGHDVGDGNCYRRHFSVNIF